MRKILGFLLVLSLLLACCAAPPEGPEARVRRADELLSRWSMELYCGCHWDGEYAAQEIYDYLCNGNIRNSVNLPNASLERMGKSRLCVIHRNVPNVINSILDLVSERNINVEHMLNKPRDAYAYTMIDLSERINGEITSQLSAHPDVLRVRVL